MGLERFIAKHFGGVPRSFKDLEWIYRVRPSDPAITPVAEDFRTISPGYESPLFGSTVAHTLGYDIFDRRF
ncbi:UNVERIFIED_CONTAM: hypothetical protein HDU68_003479 [Siphonaria sp. JEL0065]|nr:hypothetical protein HDU68_003479 [Siphonaria sp. JEL0065]